MAAKVGPTLRRIQLGQELLRLREKAGLTLAEASTNMPFDKTRLSKLENGTTKLRTGVQLRALLESYGVQDEKDMEFLLNLHADSLSKEWWSPFRSVMPSGMALYVGLEAGARTMRAWQPNLVFGLLQTERYARALFETAKPVEETTTEFVERNIQLRMERKELITRSENPVELSVIMGEAAVSNVYGDRSIMREQYGEIAELAKRDNVTVQILPSSKASYRATGDFTLLEFDPPFPTAVHADGVGAVNVVDKETEVWAHARKFDAMRAEALGPGETPHFLEQLARKWM
ncbi:helix-turn-helix transcriptional regulator [Streptomyces chrestomyceticus]|uniref:helix-turn-helix domain-containing protein n=1 Tax=Streptomyces chrestomyceticus TaxID=68185 RepID=UPI0033CC7433